jgi:5-methylcytosine-specific restriction enzyme A
MPSRPSRPCARCGKLFDDKRCPACTPLVKQQSDARRGSAHSRGYTSRWTEYSKQYRCDHPLCVMCAAEGIVAVAGVVDHIVPHKGDYGLMWDDGNHQPLCKRHHDTKTATEDGAFGNRQGGEGKSSKPFL